MNGSILLCQNRRFSHAGVWCIWPSHARAGCSWTWTVVKNCKISFSASCVTMCEYMFMCRYVVLCVPHTHRSNIHSSPTDLYTSVLEGEFGIFVFHCDGLAIFYKRIVRCVSNARKTCHERIRTFIMVCDYYSVLTNGIIIGHGRLAHIHTYLTSPSVKRPYVLVVHGRS